MSKICMDKVDCKNTIRMLKDPKSRLDHELCNLENLKRDFRNSTTDINKARYWSYILISRQRIIEIKKHIDLENIDEHTWFIIGKLTDELIKIENNE